MINVSYGHRGCVCVGMGEREGSTRIRNKYSMYFTDGSLLCLPRILRRQWGNGACGQEGGGSARLVGWDTIGNDYIKCIVVTFANRS
jgi:hypothetical protein